MIARPEWFAKSTRQSFTIGRDMPTLPIGARPGLRFIHAGANDGITNDWLYRSIIDEAWQGVCLEPQPAVFAKLQTTYAANPRVRLVPGAIASEPGDRTLYSFRHPHPPFHTLCDKLASFDQYVLLANVAIELPKFPELVGTVGAELERWLEMTTVRCYTIPELIALYDLEPDLIALDIEGSEDEILMSLDLERVRPSFVFFEAFH